MTFETLTSGIKELFESTKFLGEHLDVDYFIEKDQDFEDFGEEVRKQIDECSIIYYSNAMNFLMENDVSLSESMTIASEYGYEVENINSELLATLLLQSELRSEFSEIENLVEDLFDSYEEENEEE